MINKKAMIALILVAVSLSAVWALQPKPATENAQVVRQGQPLATVSPPLTLSAKAQIGKTAFEAKCAACHGDNGAGRNGFGPPLIHKIYEPSHHGDMAFLVAAQNGVRAHHWGFGNMPPVEGVTRGDVIGIVTYIREVQRENGIN